MDPGVPDRIEQMIAEMHPTDEQRVLAKWNLALGPSYARTSQRREEEDQETFARAMADLLGAPQATQRAMDSPSEESFHGQM